MKNTRALKGAYLTEVQAIAIYEAECAVLRGSRWTARRKRSLEIFEQTLKEEREHRDSMSPYLEDSISPAVFSLNLCAGYCLGFLLALLPSRLSWVIHAWAEAQAEKVYRNALNHCSTPEIRSALERAAIQEHEHQLRFKRMLS